MQIYYGGQRQLLSVQYCANNFLCAYSKYIIVIMIRINWNIIKSVRNIVYIMYNKCRTILVLYHATNARSYEGKFTLSPRYYIEIFLL